MSITIVEERPDSADAVQLIVELDALLNSLPYPQESRHAFSVDKLLREGVAFFITRYEGKPAGCGGLKLFGTEYGEVKRMYVRPAYRGLGLGKLILNCLAEYARERQVGLFRVWKREFTERKPLNYTNATVFSAGRHSGNIKTTR